MGTNNFKKVWQVPRSRAGPKEEESDPAYLREPAPNGRRATPWLQ